MGKTLVLGDADADVLSRKPLSKSWFNHFISLYISRISETASYFLCMLSKICQFCLLFELSNPWARY